MKICSRKRCWEVAAMVALLLLTAAIMQAQLRTPPALEMPQSHNPISPYTGDQVPEPVLTNSPRLDRLIRDGKLYYL
jgi:hypothetical protein